MAALDPPGPPLFHGASMARHDHRSPPRRARLLQALLAAGLLAGCRAATPAAPASTAAARPEAPPAWEADNPLRPLPEPPLGSPADFAAVPWVTPAKVRLGRWLFFDARLSADGTISCASCHRPEHGFSEPTPHSTGVGGKEGGRKAPPILNAAFPVYPAYFWDGRAASLLEQAKGPMVNPVEMGATHQGVVATVSRLDGYRRYFAEAFGDPGVDIDRVAEALAAYEATRLSGNSKVDRFDAGDEAALDESERRGRDLFFGRAACNQCHLGPGYTDGKFHNLGVGWREPEPGAPAASGFADPGRAAISGDQRDLGAFKTPSLRDCSKHAPYMHDGSVETLREAVALYWRGGVKNPWLSERMEQVGFRRCEIDDLVAFLQALDGEGYQDTAPSAFPR
ncbi:MAG: cytochrome-c peroxidase [Anaeromyxobacter sp.]|nr:cytochrome-c peroxidase [Anaeromyxobacter sp.]